ncbi:MAG: hypothetical protein CR981_01745 [Proteobacteria bacterium]|nr:MAG: hypothetical protein CR981_01745 [Pseudomonadota bacterium]
MLQIFRDKAQSLVIQAIVVIIALVFIFWGVGTNMNSKQEAAIIVNDEQISFQHFQRAYEQAYDTMAQRFGGRIPKELVASLNIKHQVINQLSQESLLRQGGHEMGLSVSGPEIQKEITSMPQFQSNGTFDLEKYERLLAANRLSPQKYEHSLQYDLLSNKTVSSISHFALDATDFEVEELYDMEKGTVTVSFVTISPTSFSNEIEINDEELEKWFETAGARYQSEPQVKLTYLPFSYEELGKKITIDEQAIQTYYDEHQALYKKPEQRHARHILLKAADQDSAEHHEQQRKKAEEILEKARKGEDFSSLAKEFSEGPTGPTGGDLRFFPQGQMVKPFDDAVFSMQEGEISDIVKTDFGYHIIKLEEIKPAETEALEQVEEDIASLLKREQAKPLAFQMANEAYENIIGAGSLSAFLEKSPDIKIIDTDFFSQSAPPEGMSSDPAFLQKAFALKKGELSSLIETGSGYVIISATETKAPAVPELSSVKEKATTDFKAEQMSERARRKAEELLKALSDNPDSFQSLAEAAGLELQNSGRLNKGEENKSSTFPPELVQTAFRLSSSSPLPEEAQKVGDTYYVFRFDERNQPMKPLTEEERTRYRNMLLAYKQQQIVEAWIRGQQDAARITISKSLENY